MLVSLTVGKVDAGVAVLLTEDKRLIEFPSILLPPDIHSGSIVDIDVSRNQHAELIAEQKFSALQSEIFSTFGTQSPSPPVLRCRNATQTSIVLEWDPIQLATAELRSLSLYRNGTKAGVIPRDKLSTKISGLALDTEYVFHLVLRTSAGQYNSERLTVRTHKMTDLSGITITPGIMAAPLKDSLAESVNRIGAKLTDSVRIDTTHFVCTEARGQAWEKAVEMNVPVVVPDWIKGCEREGRIVGVRGYYLDADPRHRQMGPSQQQVQMAERGSVSAQGQTHRDGPTIEHTPPTPDGTAREHRGEDALSTSAAEPPAPIAKDEDEEEESIAGTTVVEKQHEPASEDDADEDDAEKSGDHEDGKGEQQTEDGHSNDDSEEQDRPAEQGSSSAADEDGRFDEVAL